MKNPLLAAVAAPLLGCLAGTAAAHAASDDALAVLQQQVRALGRQVAQQHAEIDALRARVVQLQMGQRGKGYPGDPLGAQLLRGEPVAGVPVQPATAPGAIVLAIVTPLGSATQAFGSAIGQALHISGDGQTVRNDAVLTVLTHASSGIASPALLQQLRNAMPRS